MRILITSSHIVNEVNFLTLPEEHPEVKEGRHMPWIPQMANQFPFCIVFCNFSWKRQQDSHWCKCSAPGALPGITRTVTDRYLHWKCKWEMCCRWVTSFLILPYFCTLFYPCMFFWPLRVTTGGSLTSDKQKLSGTRESLFGIHSSYFFIYIDI